MDVSQMISYHESKQADVTVAANVVPASEASQFGCIKTDNSGRIIEFLEKPAEPPEIPGNPGFCYVSMGNYVFNRVILEDALIADAQQPTSHDFGRDIIPGLVAQKAHVYAYDFSTNQLPHFEYESQNISHWRVDKPYWRDVGTIKSYWEAHMELLYVNSEMTLYNPLWPIRTVSFADPPSYSYPSEGNACIVDQVLQAEGSRILGAEVQKSVLSRNCAILPGSKVEESIIGQGVVVGKNCHIKKTIIDSHNVIPEGTIIGEDLEEDAKKYTIDPKSGVVVIGMPKIRYQKDIDEKTLDGFSWSSFS
jgi:glucose-1-phosphate adenylyltransferase